LAVFGARAVQAVFDELKSELGTEIDDAIIEAQKNYSLSLAKEQLKSAQQKEPDRQVNLKLAMAITGLGHLVEVDVRWLPGARREPKPAVGDSGKCACVLRIHHGEARLLLLGDHG
jgi:hypothetical protein